MLLFFLYKLYKVTEFYGNPEHPLPIKSNRKMLFSEVCTGYVSFVRTNETEEETGEGVKGLGSKVTPPSPSRSP